MLFLSGILNVCIIIWYCMIQVVKFEFEVKIFEI